MVQFYVLCFLSGVDVLTGRRTVLSDNDDYRIEVLGIKYGSRKCRDSDRTVECIDSDNDCFSNIFKIGQTKKKRIESGYQLNATLERKNVMTIETIYVCA